MNEDSRKYDEHNIIVIGGDKQVYLLVGCSLWSR